MAPKYDLWQMNDEDDEVQRRFAKTPNEQSRSGYGVPGHGTVREQLIIDVTTYSGALVAVIPTSRPNPVLEQVIDYGVWRNI